MRSGFLNASPSDSLASSLDKGSRNKRKFRTDQQQQTSGSPVSVPICGGEGSKIGVYIGEACSNAAMDPQSINNVDAAVVSPGIITCCNSGQNFMPPDHINYPSHHHPNIASTPLSEYTSQASEFPVDFQHFTYSKDGQDSSELQQDSEWDRLSEAQLEEILINMLDGVYKDAVKKVSSFNFTQEEALTAVLRNGRWNKRDALTSIVENALAWLQNSEARGSNTDLIFPGLKEMENYVLAEMICMLQKVRPYLSKGDAMWCLLMCDLNVLLACTMEEDSVPLSVKDGTAPSVVLSKFKQPTDTPLPNVPPTSTTTVVPLPQQTPCSSQASTQPCNLLVSSYKENRSAFSTPSFSSSPVGKVAVASRKGNSPKQATSLTVQTSTTSLNNEAVASSQEQTLQSGGALSSHQHSLPPQIEEHVTKLGLHISHSNNGAQFSETCGNWKSDHLVPRVGWSDASPVYSQDVQMAQTAQRSDVFAKNFRPEHASAFQPGFTGTKLKGNKIPCSAVPLPSINKQAVQTELQIGSINNFPGFQVPPDEAWMNSGNVGSLASSGAELSLATASVVSSVSTDLSSESPIEKCTNDDFADCTKPSVSSSQMHGCINTNAEERKTVMLWQLVDHVKYLEAQLQDWTDWAQQKVMQAARRLTKDTAELKALRQERDEYMRLKKEKQALEESTMKKLAEMEASLGKALSQVDRANSTAWRLEAENAEVRKEMETAKATAAESVYVCQEATKREKKSMKKAQGWEKQKLKLQDELIEGKQTLFNLLEQLSQARERYQQAEVRWRQEKKVKEEAQVHAETEKRAKELAEHSAKKREEALQRKSEAQSQRYRDEVQKLENEIARVRLSLGLQPSVLSWGNGYQMSSSNLDTCSAEKLKQMNARLQSEIADLRQSQKEIHHDRACMMCMSEEMSMVFLPCAHQVVCVRCSDLHQKKGNRDCPSCRTPIQQRIRVYGVRP